MTLSPRAVDRSIFRLCSMSVSLLTVSTLARTGSKAGGKAHPVPKNELKAGVVGDMNRFVVSVVEDISQTVDLINGHRPPADRPRSIPGETGGKPFGRKTRPGLQHDIPCRGLDADIARRAGKRDTRRVHRDRILVLIRQRDLRAGIIYKHLVAVWRDQGDIVLAVVEEDLHVAARSKTFDVVGAGGGLGGRFGAAVEHPQHDSLTRVVVDETHDHLVAYLGPEVSASVASRIQTRHPGPDPV